MDTSSLSNCGPKFVIVIACESCGMEHPVVFANEKEFFSLTCRHSGEKVLSSLASRKKVWDEFQNDIFSDAVAV